MKDIEKKKDIERRFWDKRYWKKYERVVLRLMSF